MTTEARDALAKALRRERQIHAGHVHLSDEARAVTVLAALDGWTLVPVDTVAAPQDFGQQYLTRGGLPKHLREPQP